MYVCMYVCVYCSIALNSLLDGFRVTGYGWYQSRYGAILSRYWNAHTRSKLEIKLKSYFLHQYDEQTLRYYSDSLILCVTYYLSVYTKCWCNTFSQNKWTITFTLNFPLYSEYIRRPKICKANFLPYNKYNAWRDAMQIPTAQQKFSH